MSRMTSAQVIGLGQYLEPDFDPSTLTVSQLLGVLGFHNIIYPTPYSKPKLVQTFNEQVKTKSSKFKKERLKKENSIASDDGITDGLTGQPIGTSKAQPARRSSRRLSQAPVLEETSPPPKRRRSSAQPSLGGVSRRIAPTQPALVEESEPEEAELPVRKVGRSKKTSEAAGAHARRVSTTEDSGWEDNNIFQSGAESSSPLRPSPVRPKATRKSIAPRRSRKSASAPPQLLPSSSPPRPSFGSPLSPPRSEFNPQLPSGITREIRMAAPAVAHTGFNPVQHTIASHSEDDDYGEPDEAHGDADVDIVGGSTQQFGFPEDPALQVDATGDLVSLVHSEDESNARHEVVRVNQETRSHRWNPMSFLTRCLFLALAMAAASTVMNYKTESASIGYCDAGSNTNSALEDLRGRRNAVEACNKENRTLLYLPPLSLDSSKRGETAGENMGTDLTPCPLPPLLPLPQPETCTPCPEHATCTQHTVTCDTGYLLRPHPLLFFLPSPSSSSPIDLVGTVLSTLTDGLPGLGPVALPLRCVEDPKRKRHIGVLGKGIEAILGQTRGMRVCAGDHGDGKSFTSEDGGDAKKWGIELENLRTVMKKKTAPHLLTTFDDTFNEAIQQLIQWGGVIIGEDRDGVRYLAHKTPDFTWDCVLTVKSREIWAEYRARFFGVLLVFVSILFERRRRTQNRIRGRRVAELVQIALDTLRNQELAYHTDPITAPQPYLSSLQLRDVILQDEHSIPTRRKLWDRVERVVEGNANVRANLEEIQGGDEMRVWRWVGSSGRQPGVRRLELEQEAEA